MYARVSPVIEWLLLLVGLLLWILTAHPISGDGRTRFEALDTLLRHGDVSTTPYSMVGPLCSAPFWWLGYWLGPSPEWWCARFNAVIFAVGVFALYRVLRPALPAATRRRCLIILTYASMFPHHTHHYSAEVFTTMLVAMGMAGVVARGSRWGWALIVLGVVNVPATGAGMAATGVVFLRDPQRGRWAIALLATAGLLMLESWIRRGHPLTSGYEANAGFATLLPYSGRPGFSYPLFLGVLGILFSFGKGLIFFTPGLFVGSPRTAVAPATKQFYRVGLLFVIGLILVYAKWWAWYGGWFWGPRFFLFACVPASLLLALALGEVKERSLGRNVLVAIVLTLSFWVGFSGKAFGLRGLHFATENDFALEYLVWYVPEFSPLWYPFLGRFSLASEEWVLVAWYAVVYAVVAGFLLRTLGERVIRAVREVWVGVAQPSR